MRCPICGCEEFTKDLYVPLTDGEGFTVNSKNTFKCTCCGYILMFDASNENVCKSYRPKVDMEE